MRTSFSNPRAGAFVTGVAALAAVGLLMALIRPVQAAPATGAGHGKVSASADFEASLRDVVSRKLGRILVSDVRLNQVADWLARQAGSGRPSDRGAVRDRLWREGVIDFEFSPISLVVPEDGSAESASSALLEVLNDPSVPWSRYNTLAVATASMPGTVGVGLILLRRVARIQGGGVGGNKNHSMTITLSGDYRDPRLFITAPHGSVASRDGRLFSENNWRVDARPLGGAGISLWEIVASGPRGPEVLALWQREVAGDSLSPLRNPRPPPRAGGSSPIAHNPYLRRSGGGASSEETDRPASAPAQLPASDAAAWVVGARLGPNRAPKPADVALAEEHLWSLIQETRRSRGLVALRRVPALTRAARRHASDLGRGERFGHETSSGNALSRIEAQGLTALRATENVAVAANVVEAHAALMASPAHRANILDSEVSAGAVGVVLKRDSRGRWSAVASELFAQLLAEGPGDQWVSAVLNRINDRRGALELPLLRPRDKLAELAGRTSARVLESRSPDLSPTERKEIAEAARFHYLNVRRVGVDLLVTADPTGVDRIAHALDPSFRELGIGIARLEEPMGDHSAGALVITLVFIER